MMKFTSFVFQRILWTGLCMVLIFSSCTSNPSTSFPSAEATQAVTGTATPTPFQPKTSESIPAEANQAAESPVSRQNSSTGIWISPNLPEAIKLSVSAPAGFTLVNQSDASQVQVAVGDQNPISQWVYALVAPFPTIPDGVSSRELQKAWKGKSTGLFSGQPVLLDQTTYELFSSLWGVPAENATKILPADQLVEYAWENRPSWAIIPFENIQPRWKVLDVDGQSPLRKEFNRETYPLLLPVSLQGDPQAVQEILDDSSASGTAVLNIPPSNYDPQLITTIVLTGVTALVRATATTMERKGITYPAEDLGNLLKSADLTHISNEIPFVKNCPPPDPSQQGLRFCSDPAYIELLEVVGTDIVELTGDHFGDYGSDNMIDTLDMYKERGWIYYGGGYTLEDGRQARTFEHNGNRFAILGCNGKGGGYATASSNNPGAVACDYDWMHKEIARLKKDGYIVIVTFQHNENYTYKAQLSAIPDFEKMAEAGADIVSGSQAHQPQAFEFLQNGFIHYGLGNLFFDQWHCCVDFACDDAFIDRHVFYNGKYIGNELITITFVDFAKPRLMTEDERTTLLQKVFQASGW